MRRTAKILAAVEQEVTAASPDKMVALRASVEALHALTDHAGIAMQCMRCRHAVNDHAAYHTRRHSPGKV